MRRRLGDVLLVACTFALVGGSVHALVAWVQRAFFGEMLRTWMSADIGWSASAGYLVLYLPLALIVVAVATLVPRRSALAIAVFCFGSLSALGTLLLFPRLHQYASLALALGIGARLAGWAAREDAWRRGLRRSGAVLAVAAVAMWAWQSVVPARRERSALAALANAAPEAPNVLLIILDTVRASALSLYGAERATTPRLSEFARGATVFDWAFSTAPWTLPSHATIFTGRYPSEHAGDWASALPATHATLAEAFASRGYATGAFTANLIATPRGTGLERGFHRYQDFPRTLGQIALATSLGQAESLRDAWDALVKRRWIGGALRALGRFDLGPRYSYPDNANKDAARVSREFLAWQSRVTERPFFAFLNYFDAHGPFLSPSRYDTVFGPGQRARDKYDRSIRYLDDELGALFDSLAARGVLDRTIVVLTADHGEQFGEHGLGWHSNSLYAQLLHVPLVVRYPPSVPAGARVSHTVSLRDIASTLNDLASPGTTSPFGGATLRPTWTSTDIFRPIVVSPAFAELSRGINPDSSALNLRGDMRAIADDSLHVIRNGDGRVEVYAYRRDPAEERDLSATHGALIPRYEAAMRAALGAAAASRDAGRP